MKLSIAALLLMCSVTAFAATVYTVKSGDTLSKIAAANNLSLTTLVSYNPQIKNINYIYIGQKINLVKTTTTTTTTTAPKPTTTTPTAIATTTPKPTTSTVVAAGENRFSAYITGYGWPDNTPKGSAAISQRVLHSLAGGIGTYSDPVTLAVGHSMATGRDVLDYPAGTKFYIPTLRKYFIVEDTCGDGSAPQNGPCHTGKDGNPWLDVWVGGNSTNESATIACEHNITGTHLVIKNPASNYVVVTGDVASSCTEYGDTVVTK
jgi:hypothetical protein